MKVVKNTSAKVKFLYRRNKYLTPTLKKLLHTTSIQPHFDYGCTSWFPLLNNNLKQKLQAAQNNCICLYLDLPPRSPVGAVGASSKNELAPSFCKCWILHCFTVFKYFNWVLPSYINMFGLHTIGISNTRSQMALGQTLYLFLDQKRGLK